MVKDTKTAKSIAAHLSLTPVSGCGWSTTGTDGKYRFELQVPSDTPLTFGACAEGYKPKKWVNGLISVDLSRSS